jgi:hypothetical protein
MVSKFAQYVAKESKRMFPGTLVKYVQGEWQMGPDKAPISPNKRFVAVVDTVMAGFFKWGGGAVTDHKMGLVADGFLAPHRDELDDLSNENWETNEYGERQDPWQKTSLFVLIAANEPHDVVTFTTTTAGGQGAILDLCEAHLRTTEGNEQYPVVMLTSGSHPHKNRAFGHVKVPVFKIVDCVEAGPFNAIVAEARGGAGFIPMSPPGTGPIAIANGRRPPTPPTPPEIPPPIITAPDSPGEFDEQIPF